MRTNATVWLLPSRLFIPRGKNGVRLLNPYVYGFNSPRRLADRTGLDPDDVDEDCKQGVQDCTSALDGRGVTYPDGSSISDCITQGMGDAVRYSGGDKASYMARFSSVVENCAAGSVCENVLPLPQDCNSQVFNPKCR